MRSRPMSLLQLLTVLENELASQQHELSEG